MNIAWWHRFSAPTEVSITANPTAPEPCLNSPQSPDGPRRTRDLSQVLIGDRAGQFTCSFDAVFTAEGIRILASPPQAPRANAICERIIGTLRRELLDQLLILNEHHLRRVLTEYMVHYNATRPRALGQLAPAQGSHPATGDQSRRTPDPPKTSPRRTHARVPDRRLTAPPCCEKKQVTAMIVYSSPAPSAGLAEATCSTPNAGQPESEASEGRGAASATVTSSSAP